MLRLKRRQNFLPISCFAIAIAALVSIAPASHADSAPQIDWNKAHILADRIAARHNSTDYESALALIDEWLDARVHLGAQDYREDYARRLAPFADVWEKLREATREMETFNLDKRPFVLSLIADLAAATRAPSS